MKNDKQLGQEQRYVIDRLLRQGKSQKEIADVFWHQLNA
jgi:transposase